MNTTPTLQIDYETFDAGRLVRFGRPPAKEVAYLVAQEAVDQLLDALPELRLAVPAGELTWRPGPFQRALTALPVEFPEFAPLTIWAEA